MARRIKYYLSHGPILYAIIAIIITLIILGYLIYVGINTVSIGFLITPLLTIFLIIIWDGYNSRKKVYSILSSFELELSINIISLEKNVNTVVDDIEAINGKQHVVTPLKVLSSEMWDMIKLNTPSELLKNNFIGRLAGLYFHIAETNEIIHSRENFRINNGAMVNFSSSLKIYDLSLLRSIEILTQHLEDIINSSELNELLDLNHLKKQLDSLISTNKKIREVNDSHHNNN